MSSKVYVMRHGETEWSKNGRHTGKTDLPLTAEGEKRVSHSASRIVGDDTLIAPCHIVKVFVSPRQRAKKTLELLQLQDLCPNLEKEETEEIAEWDYGDYEGLTSKEINDQLGHVWNVFRDGCPNGDTYTSVTKRLDPLIAKIREIHAHAQNEGRRSDVLVVAHGHILRAFTARWIGLDVRMGTHFSYGAGGAGVLGYEHNSLEEPVVDTWNVTDLTLR